MMLAAERNAAELMALQSVGTGETQSTTVAVHGKLYAAVPNSEVALLSPGQLTMRTPRLLVYRCVAVLQRLAYYRLPD
eukprot:SAG31_NODE_19804_length_591_cov_0.971545_1_plen_78_part_00